MKIDNTTMLLIGGGALAVFFFMQRRTEQAAGATEADVKFQQLAMALNATQAQQVEMAAMFEKALAKSGGSVDKALRDQQLMAGYMNMGLGAATAIADIAASIASIV